MLSARALNLICNRMARRDFSRCPPEKIIEIKLNPMIQGLSRVVNNFGKNAETQARAVDANLKQTQELLDAVTKLLSELRAGQALGSSPSSGIRPVASLSQPVSELDREQRG
jgi:hypothetical protein